VAAVRQRHRRFRANGTTDKILTELVFDADGQARQNG
jgi:hypothetical protein